MVCGFSLPEKISEDDLGFFMRQRLRFASPECGMTLTAEKAKNWAPQVFQYLSRQALLSIPNETLYRLDRDRVQHIPSAAIIEMGFCQFLNIVSRLSLAQLFDVMEEFDGRLSGKGYQEVVKRLNVVQERWIQGCNPANILAEESLAGRLRSTPGPFRILALAKYYWQPSERSTEELLKLSEWELQDLSRLLSRDALVECFKKATLSQRVAILLRLEPQSKDFFISKLNLDKEKADMLERTYEVMQRSLQAEYRQGFREGVWRYRSGMPLFGVPPFPV